MSVLEPIKQGFLPIENGHEVAYYEFGNPQGIPVLFLHGGPGSGFNRDYLSFFPLDQVRLITFDQRGSGNSKPFACLENNATQDLIRDIERLRALCQVEKWLVVGHSWGSTLALFYAKSYPEICEKVLLVSFFGGLREDQEWTFDKIRVFFPEETEALHALHTDKAEPFFTWVDRALHSDQKQEVAYRLSLLGAGSCRMTPQPLPTLSDITEVKIAKWQILMRYGLHDFYLSYQDLYEGLEILTMPVYALHGRFDMDCPLYEVDRLKKALPALDLRIVAGNHSVSEEPMGAAFRALVGEMCI